VGILSQLKKQHFFLIEIAKKTIASRFKEERHHAAAAVKSKSGKIYTGVQLKTSVGKAAICAVASAIANAANEGDTEIEAVVAVNRYGEVFPPCGICRELLLDYAPKAEVVVPGLTGNKIMTIQQILPVRQGFLCREQ
jgi:cytidine deaminase